MKVRTLEEEVSNNREAASGCSVDTRHVGADPDPDPVPRIRTSVMDPDPTPFFSFFSYFLL
jgi:hypothetical protein